MKQTWTVKKLSSQYNKTCYNYNHSGIGKALEEIIMNKDILYDTGVVDTCIRLFKEKGFSLDQQRF